MSRFGGMSKASVNQGGIYFPEGAHDVTLSEIKFLVDRQNRPQVIIKGRLDKTTSAMPLGSEPAQHLLFLGDGLAAAKGNFKAIVGLLLGIDDVAGYVPEGAENLTGEALAAAQDKFWEEACELYVSDEQPAKGEQLHLVCVKTVSKKTGKPYTRHTWSRLEG